MTDPIRNPHVEILCRLASEDESALQYPLPDHLFGFVAQQSCEKFLKALISSHNRRYPFTHELETLLSITRQLGEDVPLSEEIVRKLKPFAVELRYQGENALPEADRDLLRAAIPALREFVLRRILELEAAW